MKKVIEKGYTITVVSWENDGDNYNTKSITVDSKEKAKAYYGLMKLCESENNQKKGVIKLGNSCDEFSEEQIEVIVNFLKANPILLEGDDVENADDEQIVDWFYSLTYDLLGSSEYYACRVMESCNITYSENDIVLEEVTF